MSKLKHDSNGLITSTKASKNDILESSANVVTDALVELYICPITHELMVDPVTAEDGQTYERAAIENWLERNERSPLDPSTRIRVTNLTAVRTVQKSIESLIESGFVDGKLSDHWKEKKKEMNCAMKKSQKLFDEGSVMEAAKMGLPEAQGKVAGWYRYGRNGMEKDKNMGFAWAKKAADGKDMYGQLELGHAYNFGEGVHEDVSMALSWYEKAANQGCTCSMCNLGLLYEHEGIEIDQNFDQKAASWYEKAANHDFWGAMLLIGKCYYNGKGVSKDLKVARKWFKKLSDKASVDEELYEHMEKKHMECKNEAKCWLGKMMLMGEGGVKNRANGLTLIEHSASNGYSLANELIELFSENLAERLQNCKD